MTLLERPSGLNEIDGVVLMPRDRGFDEARRTFNGMMDKHPALIVQCRSTSDVVAAVRAARGAALPIAVRGGGHSVAGHGVADDALVVDLRHMRNVEVDPRKRTARAEGGAQWLDVDTATVAHGLATTGGTFVDTGIAGLTLTGGIGYLMGTGGFTCDRLIGAEVVTTDGAVVRAGDGGDPDLLWALRGGGGNFGVVTSFSFTCVPVANVVAGPMFWPIERTEEILSWYRGFIGEQPTELGGFFNFHSVPPVDMFPEQYHLDHVCGVVWCCTDFENANELLAPARALAPIIDGVAEVPLPAMNTAFDGLYSP
ncbi:MAG: FAD-binding oxidoreductase, partial [Chloroflexota bacterium]